MAIRLEVLGGLQAFQDGSQLGWVPSQRIRSALLVYLALEPAATREQVARVLWPDEDSDRSRHTLSQNLYLLRRALGEGCITETGGGLRLNTPIEIDAREFERAVEAGEAAAAARYRGAFLKDLGLCESREFESWVDRERAKYGRLHRRARRGQIEVLVSASRLADAVEAARAWVRLEPFDDEAQHRLVELLAASGQRSEALQQYDLYQKQLAAEELAPLDETVALVAQLRAAELGGAAFGAVMQSPPAGWQAQAEAAAVVQAAPATVDPGFSGSSGLASLAAELRPGLELLRPLGEGRSGSVYLAREPSLNRLVAVKVLSPELAADHVARTRFEREARAAAALNHPHAVAVYRFGYLGSGVPYLVLQYVNGATLEEKLAAEGPPSVAHARRVLAEVADALAAAHAGGFVHRDLRPANVLCDEKGDRVLVADFGLAGVLPEAGLHEQRVTRAGEVLGVPEYTSPEQLRGEAAGPASDVYALGIMGYRLLAGDGPFRATRGSALLAAHLNETPRPLLSLRPDVEPSLAELLERCLAKDPGRRPSAAFVARALREPPLPADARAAPAAPSPATGRVLQGVMRRRLPQIVAVTAAAGLGLLSFVEMLTDRSVVPEVVFRLSLASFGYSIAAAAVMAWFHGHPGRQRVRWLEVGVLVVVALAWLVTCALIVVR